MSSRPPSGETPALSRVLVLGSRAMVRAHVHDMLKPYFAVTAVEDVEAAEAWLHDELDGSEEPAPVAVLLAETIAEGTVQCRQLREGVNDETLALLLISASADGTPKDLGALPEDVIRGRYDRMDLVVRVRSLGTLAATRRRLCEQRDLAERLSAELDEERAMLEQLSRFVSPHVAEVVRSGDALRAPERIELSVLFSDIRGFTDATAFCAPEDTIELLNDYLPEVNRIIADHGGQLDKFMGDGILAYFPPVDGGGDHGQSAVLAAIAMQERLEELKVQWFERGFLPVGVGVGVTTGMVTLGTLGAGDRLDYTVIGSTVNLAARLQGLARGGDIVIDESTYARVRSLVSVRDGRMATVKGFEEPIRVFNVAYLEPAPTATHAGAR